MAYSGLRPLVTRGGPYLREKNKNKRKRRRKWESGYVNSSILGNKINLKILIYKMSKQVILKITEHVFNYINY